MNDGSTTMLMNPHTGSVASLADWQADFESMSAEEWGGGKFESAELVEVDMGPDGTWMERS